MQRGLCSCVVKGTRTSRDPQGPLSSLDPLEESGAQELPVPYSVGPLGPQNPPEHHVNRVMVAWSEWLNTPFRILY